MVYKFSSTSKISFPGSGIAAIAASDANLADIRKQMRIQTIGHDKLNQLRHVRFFKDINGLHEHMKKHADILRPKFELVLATLDKELNGLGIGEWTKPHGGYFISFDSMEGCEKDRSNGKRSRRCYDWSRRNLSIWKGPERQQYPYCTKLPKR